MPTGSSLFHALKYCSLLLNIRLVHRSEIQAMGIVFLLRLLAFTVPLSTQVSQLWQIMGSVHRNVVKAHLNNFLPDIHSTSIE